MHDDTITNGSLETPKYDPSMTLLGELRDARFLNNAPNVLRQAARPFYAAAIKWAHGRLELEDVAVHLLEARASLDQHKAILAASGAQIDPPPPLKQSWGELLREHGDAMLEKLDRPDAPVTGGSAAPAALAADPQENGPEQPRESAAAELTAAPERAPELAPVEDIPAAAPITVSSVTSREGNPTPSVSPSPVGSDPISNQTAPEADPAVFRGRDKKSYVVYRGRCLRIDGREFREAVRFALLRVGDTLPSAEEVRAYIDRLSAKAYSAPEEQSFVRVAQTEVASYLDLANPAGEVIEVTPRGWRIITESPVRFVRPTGTLPLATPVRGGDYWVLQKFVRLSEPAFCLFLAQLTFQLCHLGPQPIMVFRGNQGTAKTTSAKVVQRICDPRTPELRQPPGSRRDLMIAAAHCWVLSFDNLSEIGRNLSDSLCTLSTGGGLGARTNHSDTEETTFDVRRPVILNGIENVIVRDDLRDRCVLFELEPIVPTERVEEALFWRKFEAAHPAILGALLDLSSRAMKELPSLAPESLPRMADFFKWALAIECAAGWPSGTVERAYADQQGAADVEALEDSFVRAISSFTEKAQSWSGTATALLAALNEVVPKKNRGPTWPEDEARLGGKLRRLSPLLERNGVSVRATRSGRRRTITLAMSSVVSPAEPSPPSLPSPAEAPSDGGDSGDATLGELQDLGAPAATVAESVLPPASALAAPDLPAEPPSSLPSSLARQGDSEDGTDAAAGGHDDHPTVEEQPSTRPTLREAIRAVLQGNDWTAQEVLEALEQRGWAPNSKDPYAYISQELSHGVKAGTFTKVRRGVFTC